MTPQGIPPPGQGQGGYLSLISRVMCYLSQRDAALQPISEPRRESHCEWERCGSETRPFVSAPLRLAPKNAFLFCAFSCLPAGSVLGSGISPLGRGGGGSGGARLPSGGLSLAPLAGSGGRESSG